MKKNTKILASVGAAGAGAVAWNLSTRGGTNAPGGWPVHDGALQWSEEFELGDLDYIVGIDGQEHRIGSYGAAVAAYSIAAHYAKLLGRTTRLCEGMLTEAQRDAWYMAYVTTGRFPIQSATLSQKAAMTSMLSAAVNFGQALRILATMSHHANLQRVFRPQVWIRRNFSLGALHFGSFLNPMAWHGVGPSQFQFGYREVFRTSGWMAVGMEIITKWLEAYRDLRDVPGMEHLVRDFEEASAILEEDSYVAGQTHPSSGMTTMGAIPIWAVGVAVIIVAVGATLVLYHAVRALTNYLFGNYAYLDDIVAQMEAALECCRDEDIDPATRQDCCEQAEVLREMVDSFKPPLSLPLELAGYAGVGLGAYWLYTKIKKK